MKQTTIKRNKRICKRNLRRGVVTVEFALVLPLLFLFLFGSFELGRANMIRHAAKAASYEGARVAILPGANMDDVEEATKRILRSVGVERFDITVSSFNAKSPSVTVEVDVPLDQNFSAASFIGGIRFVGECELSRELVSE